jgi:hypothetical protein
MLIAQAPNPDTVDSAYKALIEFGVIGAVLAIMIGGFVSLVWWDRKTSRKREEDTNNTLRQKENDHREERIAFSDAIDKRLETYRELLDDKDKAMRDMQAEHVKLVKTMVTATVKTEEKMTRVLEKLDAVLTILIDSNRRDSDD